jgi:hypothetical protein
MAVVRGLAGRGWIGLAWQVLQSAPLETVTFQFQEAGRGVWTNGPGVWRAGVRRLGGVQLSAVRSTRWGRTPVPPLTARPAQGLAAGLYGPV